jgi:F-type H+-transporting ATPase subunit epsilon
LLAELGAGDVTLHGAAGGENAGSSDRYNVSWGFVEVLPDRVTILANDAMTPAQIDTGRAREQLERGEKLWSDAGDDADKYTEAERVIREAEAKLASAENKTA